MRCISNFPQLQQTNSKWKNYTSVYYYTRNQFHEFILGLDNKDLIVYDVLYRTFREASNMHRSQITQMTVWQLKQSIIQIDRLYDELRNSMSPPATCTTIRCYQESHNKSIGTQSIRYLWVFQGNEIQIDNWVLF